VPLTTTRDNVQLVPASDTPLWPWLEDVTFATVMKEPEGTDTPALRA
jgi:hypothetical protein